MGAGENEYVKFHKITSYTLNFQNFSCVFTILVKFDIHFLGIPCEIFFGVITDDHLHLWLLKNVKRMQYCEDQLRVTINEEIVKI